MKMRNEKRFNLLFTHFISVNYAANRMLGKLWDGRGKSRRNSMTSRTASTRSFWNLLEFSAKFKDFLVFVLIRGLAPRICEIAPCELAKSEG